MTAVTIALLALIISMCLARLPTKNDVVDVAFLCADNGTFSGLSELAFVSDEVFQQEPLVAPLCQSASIGYTFGSGGKVISVIVATTEIGAIQAAACTQSILLFSGLRIQRVVFVGTSGFSPVVGGFEPLSQGGCNQLSASVERIAVGSICVSSDAFDLSCGTCVSNPLSQAETLPNECFRPNCHGHLATSLFGNCVHRVNRSLADQIFSASTLVQLPSQPAEVRNGSARWWAAHEAVPQALRSSAPDVPVILRNCAEADARQIWVGAPLDYLCREYASELINTTSGSVPCVVAMESAGFLTVVSQLQGNGIALEAAVVRAASNWDMYPQVSVGVGRWAQNSTYASDEEHLDFVKATYQYAVRTSNELILKYLKTL